MNKCTIILVHKSWNLCRTQEIQFQGLLNQVSGPSTFFPSTGTSSQIQVPNMPIQPVHMHISHWWYFSSFFPLLQFLWLVLLQGMNPFGTGSSLPFHLEGLLASNQNRVCFKSISLVMIMQKPSFFSTCKFLW